MKPTPEDIIVDPACGTAGFLVEAGEYLRKNKNDYDRVYAFYTINGGSKIYRILRVEKTLA